MYSSPDRDELLQKELNKSLREKKSLKKSNDFKLTKLKELRERQCTLKDENAMLKDELSKIRAEFEGKTDNFEL